MEYPLFLPKAVQFEMTTTNARTTAVLAAAAVAAATAVLTTTTITMSICIIKFGRGGTGEEGDSSPGQPLRGYSNVLLKRMLHRRNRDQKSPKIYTAELRISL